MVQPRRRRRVMSNKRAEAQLQLDKPRNLRLDFNTMCTAEGVLGRTVVRSDIGLSEIRAIVWAGLRHEDRTLTLERVGELLGEADINAVAETVGACLAQFFTQGEAQGAGA